MSKVLMIYSIFVRKVFAYNLRHWSCAWDLRIAYIVWYEVACIYCHNGNDLKWSRFHRFQFLKFCTIFRYQFEIFSIAKYWLRFRDLLFAYEKPTNPSHREAVLAWTCKPWRAIIFGPSPTQTDTNFRHITFSIALFDAQNLETYTKKNDNHLVR